MRDFRAVSDLEQDGHSSHQDEPAFQNSTSASLAAQRTNHLLLLLNVGHLGFHAGACFPGVA